MRPRTGRAAPGKGRVTLHPDQEAAIGEIAEALGRALGTEVRVRPRGKGYKVELSFASAEEAAPPSPTRATLPPRGAISSVG